MNKSVGIKNIHSPNRVNYADNVKLSYQRNNLHTTNEIGEETMYDSPRQNQNSEIINGIEFPENDFDINEPTQNKMYKTNQTINIE